MVATLFLSLLLIVTAIPASAGESLGFALLSARSQADAEAAWRPLLSRLSDWLGVTVEPHWYPDYAGAVWALRTDRDRLGSFGNKAAIEAVDKARGAVFAAPAAAPLYHSVLIVRRDSPFTSPEALFRAASGLTLGMGDQNSTSGTVVPRLTLFQPHGLNPQDSFLRVVVASHPDNVAAVADGRVDAATVSSKVLLHLARTRPDRVAAVRELWRSPPIPADPLLWDRDLPEPLRARILAFFLQLGRPFPGKSPATLAEERAELARLDLIDPTDPDQGGFILADDSYLVPVRRLDLLEKRWRITRGVDGGDLAAQLAAIDRQLAALAPSSVPLAPSDSRPAE